MTGLILLLEHHEADYDGCSGKLLAFSRGEEDLVSHEDKHSQDDSNADEFRYVVQVIRRDCEYRCSDSAQNQARPEDARPSLNEDTHHGKHHSQWQGNQENVPVMYRRLLLICLPNLIAFLLPVLVLGAIVIRWGA